MTGSATPSGSNGKPIDPPVAPPVVQPLHTSQVLSWVRDPAWTHKPADPPGCVE